MDLELLRRLDRIERKQNILIEQVSVLSKVLANNLGLAIEEGEDGLVSSPPLNSAFSAPKKRLNSPGWAGAAGVAEALLEKYGQD